MIDIQKRVFYFQREEATEFELYRKLAKSSKDLENKKILLKISNDEKKHELILRKYTKKNAKPYLFKLWFLYIISLVLGLNFGLKLMEKKERKIQEKYKSLQIKEIKEIQKEENNHEYVLINLLKEEKLKYTSSIVLGLSDAIVELTGALAGLTLAIKNTHLIATTIFITGIAASMSMAASEYLSVKSEKNTLKSPFKSLVYTGITYITTVLLLIIPFLFFNNVYISLISSIIISVIIIFIFTLYISIASDYSFKKRFFEMTVLSLTIALISFGIGYLVNRFFGISV